MPGAWCRAPNWSSISTTRISTAIPTPSKSSSAASARSSASTSSRPCAASAICSPRRGALIDARQFPCAAAVPLGDRLGGGHPADHRRRAVLALPARVERAFDRRLGVYLRTLVADLASPEEASAKFPQSLGEPLFELPLSGWYWQVTRLDPDKHEVRSSRSLWDGGLPHLQDRASRAGADGSREGYVSGRRISGCAWSSAISISAMRAIIWLRSPATPPRSRDETRSFDQALVDHLCRSWPRCCCSPPCSRCASASPRSSASPTAWPPSAPARRASGRKIPEEIAPLARETNALIDANKEIVERARTHVGNLAHALKTPLSVMVNEASARARDPFAHKVLEQADIMRDQVARHLERARLAAR